MIFPKYIISYTVMDANTGANPLGHATILFLKQEDEHQPMKLMDAYGGYSQPSSSTNLLVKTLKYLLGIKFDLQDTHSVMKRERIWELNSGRLNAFHIDVTETQYKRLLKHIKQIIEDEAKVIKELNHELIEQGAKVHGHHRYYLEMKKNPLSPRLKPFHVNALFNYEHSYTCKHRALDLLLSHQIINQDLAKKLQSKNFASTFPIQSDIKLSPFYLVSINGSCMSTVKNKVVCSYDWDTSDLRSVFPVQNNSDLNVFSEPLLKQLNLLKQTEQQLQKQLAVEYHEHLSHCKSRILHLIEEFTQLSLLSATPAQFKQYTDDLIEKSQRWIDISTYAMLPDDHKNSFDNHLYKHPSIQTIFQAFITLLIGLILACCSVPMLPKLGILLSVSASVMLFNQIINIKSLHSKFQHSNRLYQHEFQGTQSLKSI